MLKTEKDNDSLAHILKCAVHRSAVLTSTVLGVTGSDNGLAFIMQLICRDSKYLSVVGELSSFAITIHFPKKSVWRTKCPSFLLNE